MSTIPEGEHIKRICADYCKKEDEGPLGVASPNAEERLQVLTAYTALSLEELQNKLLAKEIDQRSVGDALCVLATKSAQAQALDDALQLYECSAQKYLNILAALRLAGLYRHGTEALLHAMPGTTMQTSFPPDPGRAFYWINVALLLESEEHMGVMDASTEAGWNAIAMFDTLSETGILDAGTRATLAKSAQEFVAKRYPSVLKSEA